MLHACLGNRVRGDKNTQMSALVRESQPVDF